MDAIDLFAGFGGFTTGAKAAGINVVWAANHWPQAVHWHSVNHPDTAHVCQDLHQADWRFVPRHDIMLASPCCQGHSRARGKKRDNPEHDASRSTAWAVVSAAEYHRPKIVLVENVEEFMSWRLYPAWAMAMKALGYALSPHVIDAADLGVPQNRVRLFLVATQSKAKLKLKLPQYDHVPANSFLRWDEGKWNPIYKPGRASATIERIENGRRQLNSDRFLIPYYTSGSGKTGRSADRPIGTITTKERWALVKGDQMRMLSADEILAGMSFPPDTARPKSKCLTAHLAGNAVPPQAAKVVLEYIRQCA